MFTATPARTFHRSPGGKPPPTNRRTKAAIFAEAEGLLGSNENVDAALLEKAETACHTTISVGYDNFDVDAAYRPKNSLMHTPTVLTETVADTLMALVLSTARRVVEVAERGKSRRMDREHRPGLVRH